jgi:hypothetical protein
MNLSREERAAKRAEIAAGVRTCTRCHEIKPVDEFYGKVGSPGIYAECKECFKARTRMAHGPREAAE